MTPEEPELARDLVAPTLPADPVVLSLVGAGPSLASHRVIDYAAMVTTADGSEPFVWNSGAARLRDVEDDPLRALVEMLPSESAVLRTTERRYGIRLLARAEGYHVFLEESPSRLEVTVSAITPELARAIGTSVLDKIPEAASNVSRVYFGIWHRGREVAERTTKAVQVPAWDAVARNYPSATRAEIEAIMGFTPGEEDNASGRLIVWHGAPGTGKTTAIRALVHSWASWCAPELLMDPEAAFEDPAYLAEVIAHSDRPYDEERVAQRWRLLIAEDADRYVRADARSRDNSGLDRLLNVADGILGQGTRLLILLTTNSELSSLHPALVRPGRCLAVTEFRRFSAAGAREWLGEGRATVSGEQTLAELYALRGDVGRIGAVRQNSPGQYL